MRLDRLLLFPLHCTNYVTSLADPYMDISYNSQVYILPAYSFRLFQKITWMMLSYIYVFTFFFHQIRLYELFFRNSQIFCIFLKIFFRNTSAVHLTTVPTSAAVIICKQLFMKFLNCSSILFHLHCILKMYEIQYFHFPFSWPQILLFLVQSYYHLIFLIFC